MQLNQNSQVRLVKYNPLWPSQFCKEAKKLSTVLGDLALKISHVGSTSIPGMIAKPIIDINISVQSLEPMEPYKVPLEKLGYTFIVDPDPIDLHFFAKPFSHPRSYHIHVCTIGSWHEISDLAFRDFLISNPTEGINYGKLKSNLVSKFKGDRESYIKGKDSFIKRIKYKAMASI